MTDIDDRESRAYNRWMQLSYQCPVCGMMFHGYEEEGHKAREAERAARAAEKAQNNEEETR